MLGLWYAQGNSILLHMNTHWGLASQAIQRLSTGYRINRAADDAAGLAISEKMRAQISGLSMAGKNIQDGISMLQTAEGALNENHAMLQRMRELAVQAANGTWTDDDRKLMDLEYQQLKEQINVIARDTEFNTKKLLNGDYENTTLKIQVGANRGQTIDLLMGDMSAEAIGLSITSSIATQADAEKAIGVLDSSIKTVSSERSRMGAYQNRLEHAYNATMNTHENLTAAESRIRDADIAKEMMNFTRETILSQAAQYALSLHMQQAYSILQLLEQPK
ncbi:MAG: flagellin [Kurthia sp.]|nr:flagellin [Candidatus Kurthia equi]